MIRIFQKYEMWKGTKKKEQHVQKLKKRGSEGVIKLQGQEWTDSLHLAQAWEPYDMLCCHVDLVG